MKNALPWVLVGTGALTIGALLVLRKRGPNIPPGKLTPDVQKKVAAQIAASNDPVFLKQLATGLQKTGATPEALNALQKAAEITGKPQQVPGALSMPPITVSPSGNATSGPASYQVVSGDIPGAIAKRFGVSLSTLAKANGASAKRIMGGQIRVGETLILPVGAIDSGTAKHANGVAA